MYDYKHEYGYTYHVQFLARERGPENIYQRCSACRGLFNKVKYIISIIDSIHIRNNIITWCKSAYLIFQMKKTHAAKYYYNGSSMRWTNSRSSIVQQPDAFLKQLLTFHIKRKSNNKVWQFFYTSKASSVGSINVCLFTFMQVDGFVNQT